MQNIYVMAIGTFQRIHLLTSFHSLIWTERYDGYGDFELVAPYTQSNNVWLVVENCLEIPESDYLMWIETRTVEEQNGSLVIKVSGRDVSSIMDYRWYYPEDFSDVYTIMASPLVVVSLVVRRTMESPGDYMRDTDDVLDNFEVLPSDAAGEMQVRRLRKEKVSKIVNNYVKMVDGGFKMLLNRNDSKVEFKAYVGNDRTGSGSSTQVEFNTDLGNLSSYESVETNVDYYNSFWIEDSSGRTGRALHPGLTGWRRRVSQVNATDIDDGDDFGTLHSRGLEHLEEHQKERVISGKALQERYRYNTHYYMGDLVHVKEEGNGIKCRVVEVVRNIDANGSRIDVGFRPER